jgi:hypothetical protein
VPKRGEASRQQVVGNTHLYQREIANAAELAEEVAAYFTLNNEVRPHESLALEAPLARHRGDTPVLGLSLQEG